MKEVKDMVTRRGANVHALPRSRRIGGCRPKMAYNILEQNRSPGPRRSRHCSRIGLKCKLRSQRTTRFGRPVPHAQLHGGRARRHPIERGRDCAVRGHREGLAMDHADRLHQHPCGSARGPRRRSCGSPSAPPFMPLRGRRVLRKSRRDIEEIPPPTRSRPGHAVGVPRRESKGDEPRRPGFTRTERTSLEA